MDKSKYKLIAEPNPEFATMTFEIGYGRDYLGYSSSTRQKFATEYSKYHFGRVLNALEKYLIK